MAVEPNTSASANNASVPKSRLLNQELDFMKQLCLEETRALFKRYSRFADTKFLTEMMTTLTFAKIVTLVKDDSEVEDIWAVIDATNEGVNFMTELTQRFFMYYPTDYNQGTELLTLFTNGIEIMHPRASATGGRVGNSGIPNEQLAEMPGVGKFGPILSANRWLVPIILWQMTDPEDLLNISSMVEEFLEAHAARAQGGVT